MMYHEKFVVAIKHDGKILREIGDVVKLPFGSEFTVLVKNLNSRRAKFTLHIDGIDALDGTSIIVGANSEVEMKRFIRNGNMNEGNAYKFIERTQQIEDGPRGIRADDGVVRVEFWYEQAPPQVQYTTTIHRNEWWDSHPYRTFSSARGATASDVKLKGIGGSAVIGNLQNSVLSSSAAGGMSASYNASTDFADSEPILKSAEVNTAGITVTGSKVEQKFQTVYGFNAETMSQVIILRLVGKTANDVEVTKPVTVKTKQKCVTCGHVNKASAKFCSDCGTSLELL